jgi:hypothetical protein
MLDRNGAHLERAASDLSGYMRSSRRVPDRVVELLYHYSGERQWNAWSVRLSP